MEFAMREWLTIVIVLLIIGVLLDGIRRMRQARRNSLRMSLSMHKGTTQEELEEYGSELPNGGARIASRDNEQEAQRINRAIHQIIEPDDDVIMRKKSSPVEQTSLNLDDSVPTLMDSVTAQEKPAEPVEEPAPSPMMELEPEVGQLGREELDIENADERLEPTMTAPVESNHAEVAEITEAPVSVKPEPNHTPSKPANKPAKASDTSQTEEVLVIHVKATSGQLFKGDELLELMLGQGLRFGAMNIFHRHIDEDGEGPILFSLANMVMPGTFDLAAMEEFSTPGVSLFLTLPVEQCSYLEAFEIMLGTAKHLAESLGGELKDEQRSVMTGQTVEHYRERIRDFTRKQQLAARA